MRSFSVTSARRGRTRPTLTRDARRAAAFGVVPLKHDLAGVLPTTDAEVQAIAEQIPVRWLDVYDNDGPGPPPGTTAVGALERLGSATGVVRLEHLELVPGYRQVIAGIVRDAAGAFTPGDRTVRATSVVYVGAGGSSAATHVDRHHNLFVHLVGTKRFTVGPQAEGAFDLEPGDALYVPPYTPHGVASGDGRTISVACSWSTPGSERALLLEAVNARLRRLGLHPAGPGRHPWADAAKLAVAGLAARVRR